MGHIACHCPNIRCFDCNGYGRVAADCPDKIPPSGTPACHKKHHSNRSIVLGLPLDIITGTDTGSPDLDPSHTLTDIKATAATIHTEVTPDLITDALTTAHHIINTQVLTVIDVTHHIGHSHIEVPPLTLETAADLDHVLHTDPLERHLLNLHPVLKKQHQNIRIGNIKVSIDDPQSDYNIPDDASSNSVDDLN